MMRGRIHSSTISKKSGMSMMELLIVIVIVALLALAIIMGVVRQLQRGNDTRRKQDLGRIRTAMEEYYNDHNAYPTEDEWNAMNCRSGAGMDFLQQYLDDKRVPCDPLSWQQYLYSLNEDCDGFVLLANLQDTGDIDIAANGCDPAQGCGYGAGYNYGLTSGGCAIPKPGFTVGPGPTVVPTQIPNPVPGPFACNNVGICNNMGSVVGCPTFNRSDCNNMCYDSSNWCP